MDDAKREKIKSLIRGEIRRELTVARARAGLTLETAAFLAGRRIEEFEQYESGTIHPLEFIRVMKLYGIDELDAFEKLNEIGLKASKIN